MSLLPEDLMEGERVLLSKGANFVISSAEYGLSPYAHSALLDRMGLKGKEALGGHLHVTNLRIVFQSHAANRITGRLSIFMPEINELANESSALVKRLRVRTVETDETFVIWGVNDVIDTIELAQGHWKETDTATLWAQLVNQPASLGQGIQYAPIMDRLVRHDTEIAKDVVDIISNPLGIATAYHLIGLYRQLTADD